MRARVRTGLYGPLISIRLAPGSLACAPLTPPYDGALAAAASISGLENSAASLLASLEAVAAVNGRVAQLMGAAELDVETAAAAVQQEHISGYLGGLLTSLDGFNGVALSASSLPSSFRALRWAHVGVPHAACRQARPKHGAQAARVTWVARTRTTRCRCWCCAQRRRQPEGPECGAGH